MFQGDKYISKGINEKLSPILILFLWTLIDEARSQIQLDYLQIFHLSKVTIDGVTMQKVTHIQENPKYKNEAFLLCNHAINNKVFCIDDETYSTMLFANEY